MIKSLLSDLRLFLILLFFSASLILLDNINFFNPFKSAIQFVALPIQYGLYKTGGGVGNQFAFIFFARSAVNESRALKEQFATVLNENAELRRQLAETKGFLDQEKNLNPQNFSWVPSRPIGLSRYLLIDKGSDDGIKVNQPVVYKQYYLGKVIETSPRRSSVLLSSDPDSHISAFSSSTLGRAKGVLNGQFGSDMLFDKILHEEQIKKGDLVYSEGTEVNIPRGLILGQVAEVLERQNEVFKQAKIVNILDAVDQDIVFVITN